MRTTGRLDALFFVSILAAVALITWALPDSQWAVARNTLFLTGIAAIGTAAKNAATGAALVTFVTLFVLTYGTSARGARFIRVLQAPSDATWPTLIGITVAGLATLALSTNKISASRRR